MECLLVFIEHIQHILFRKTLLGDILHLVFYLKKMYMLQKTKEQSKSNLIKVNSEASNRFTLIRIIYLWQTKNQQ